jgi:hypothetical protein
VTADETREQIIDLHRYATAHADATIEALPLDAAGEVPWWPPARQRVSLHQILVHACGETARHAGHADILREFIDGVAGRRPGDRSMPERTAEQWAAYRARIEDAAQLAARQAADEPPPSGSSCPSGLARDPPRRINLLQYRMPAGRAWSRPRTAMATAGGGCRSTTDASWS